MDRSNGYEGIAAEFLARRGSRTRSARIGVKMVRNWAKTLPRGAAVIDLGCGPGSPITEVLVAEGLKVFGVDAAPSFVQAFRRNLQTYPWLVKRSKIRDFWIDLRWRLSTGAHVLAFSRRSAAPDPKDRRHTGAGRPATVYFPCGTTSLERCDDGIGITLSWSRGVSEAALFGWSLDR